MSYLLDSRPEIMERMINNYPHFSDGNDQEDTTASILEFLKEEQKCLGVECNSDVDVDSIFEEINRLSDQNNERSLEDILKEAEFLIQDQTKLKLSDQSIKNQNSTRFSESHYSMKRVQQSVSNQQNKSDIGNNSDVADYKDDVVIHSDDASEKNLNGILSNEESIKECVSRSTSPLNSYAIKDDHSIIMYLKQIDKLQERLKDAEERSESLKMNHDSLSQVNRGLREKNSHLMTNVEKINLELQHIRDCAAVLRSELQTARLDRAESREMQKLLQLEVEQLRFEKKKSDEKAEQESKTVHDLQRQCKEMEKILLRKHPDSVSALIVAAKNPNAVDNQTAAKRVLEQRIAQLETEAKEQDLKAQKILANVQSKFNTVQCKYETHIADLETQVLSLQEINSALNEKVKQQILRLTAEKKNKRQHHLTDAVTQTPIDNNISIMMSVATQTTQSPGKSSATGNKKPLTKSSCGTPSNKEEHNLASTLRTMRVDLAIKEKAIQRLTKDLEDQKKTVKKLIKEKEGIIKMKNPAKLYETSGQNLSERKSESVILRESQNKMKALEADYKNLYDKRIQDLKMLQSAHEREMNVMKHELKVLQDQLQNNDQKKVSVPTNPISPIDYLTLKAKVVTLERRHLEREQRLQVLMDVLNNCRISGEF